MSNLLLSFDVNEMAINTIHTTPTICLNMIVKNESRIITRLLDSVISIIDTYCICDTGSTDDTISIITNYFDKHQITGIIINEPFKNFGYNRSFALNIAREKSKADFLLLLDADMQLQIGPKFNKSKLRPKCAYQVMQKKSFHSIL